MARERLTYTEIVMAREALQNYALAYGDQMGNEDATPQDRAEARARYEAIDAAVRKLARMMASGEATARRQDRRRHALRLNG